MTIAISPVICLLTSDDETNNLCLAYWSLNQCGQWSSSLADLMKVAGKGQAALLALVRASSSAYISQIRCNGCGEPKQIFSRTDFDVSKRRARRGVLYRCHDCINAHAEKSDSLCESIVEHDSELFDQGPDPTTAPIILSYTNAVLLYSVLLAAGEQWNGKTISPISAQIAKLAPTFDLAIAIYLHLQNEKIITPSFPPARRSFPNIGEDDYIMYMPQEVTWTLPDSIAEVPSSHFIESLELTMAEFDAGAAADLWHTVAEA